jgi:hypothetical protein
VFTGDNAVKMQKLLDALEALDDVQEVYSNVRSKTERRLRTYENFGSRLRRP